MVFGKGVGTFFVWKLMKEYTEYGIDGVVHRRRFSGKSFSIAIYIQQRIWVD